MDNSSLLGNIGVQITCIQHALSLSSGKYRLSILVIGVGSSRTYRNKLFVKCLGAIYRKLGELFDGPFLKMFLNWVFHFILLS